MEQMIPVPKDFLKDPEWIAKTYLLLIKYLQLFPY
jgi:hypothetical protein